ncbi:MAG: hypothetical protein EOO01_34130 [Chitinophagaceae bacterium]|nr:MAG: hypothetical protein EOO01_34130 [Chitinophagaceae bacterium]
MKIASLFVAALSLSMISCSQDIAASKVPSVVQNALQVKFPNATKIDWEKKGKAFEADFNLENEGHELLIDGTGKVIAHKTDILPGELPQAVNSAVRQDHATYKIDDAQKIELDGIIYYQVELDAKGKKDQHLVYTAEGAIAAGVNYVK